eukprot:14140618-Heterocapsa_arctica.AAC.1
MEGSNNTPWDFEHMVGQNEAKPHKQTQSQWPGAPGAPPDAAPLWFLSCFRIALAGHVFQI